MTRRLAELFEQAIEVAPGERAAWVAAACAGDDDLRAELEHLLHSDERAAYFLERPPALIADALAESASELAAVLSRQFGPWRVLRSIGAGGMGEVWLAERSDGEFEQRGAVKQLAYPTPGLLQRFRQERQILARLEHPNIARLIDGGVDAAGAPYLVMEFVEGVPITEFVHARALDLPARLRLFLKVCDAVQYAHQNLVVHRDLKPSNIFVTAEGIPKLLDFGIAKVLATTGSAAATQTAARLLTPGYAAPEQFSGGAITTATDVYALGVVLYELLSGQRPAHFAGAPESLREPPAPSAVIDRAKDAGRRRALRGDLDRIVLTALAADPGRRYRSTDALATDIRRHLDGQPISVRSESRGYRLRKFLTRHRYGLAAVCGVIAISIGAALVSLHEARQALAEAQRADTVREFLVGVFEHARPDGNKGQPITAQELVERGERQLNAIDTSQPAIRADLAALISRLYWDIGNNASAERWLPTLAAAADDPRIPARIRARSLSELAHIENDKRLFDPAIVHARHAIAIAEDAGAGAAREANEARQSLAAALVEQNDPAALPLLRQMLAADLAAHGERSNEVVEDLLHLGSALDALSLRDEAIATLQREVALARALYGDLNSSVVNGLNALAGALLRKGDWTGAQAAYREALESETRLLGPQHASTVIIRSNFLAVLERQGQFADALHERLRMLDEGKESLNGGRDDSVALVTHLIGFDYRELGQFAKAEKASRDALAIWRRTEGADDAIDSAPPLENLGVVLYLEGRHAESEAALRQAIAIMRRRASPSSQWLARIRGELADTLRREQRFEEALRESGEATAALAETSKSAHEASPVLAVLKAQLSEAKLDMGDAAGAENTANEALLLARRALPARNYRLGSPLFALARAKLARGHADEAEALLREALAVRSAVHPANDPRVVEVDTALAHALALQDKGASQAR